MTRYTPERGYGLDLSGPEPVWRGKTPGWNRSLSILRWRSNAAGRRPWGVDRIRIERQGRPVWIPRYRIDDYIKRGLIDPARRDDL